MTLVGQHQAILYFHSGRAECKWGRLRTELSWDTSQTNQPDCHPPIHLPQITLLILNLQRQGLATTARPPISPMVYNIHNYTHGVCTLYSTCKYFVKNFIRNKASGPKHLQTFLWRHRPWLTLHGVECTIKWSRSYSYDLNTKTGQFHIMALLAGELGNSLLET